MLLWKRYDNNKMAAMRIMSLILHLQQYSHRLNLLYIFFLQSVQIDFRPNSTSYSVGTSGLFLGQSGKGVKQTTQFHIVWTLKMGGALPTLLHVTCTWIIPVLFTIYPVDFRCKL